MMFSRISCRVNSHKVSSATPEESVMHGQELAETRQTLNSTDSSNKTPKLGLNKIEMVLKDPHAKDDEPPKKKRQFELSHESENSRTMDPGLMEYVNKYMDDFFPNKTLFVDIYLKIQLLQELEGQSS